MKYLSIDWRQRSSFLILIDGDSCRDWKGEMESMTKKEVLAMLDDMKERVLRSNGFIAGFVTEGFILKLIDEKRSEVEALEGT